MMQAPKGTKDAIPENVYKWHYIERKAADVCRRFGFKEIRTPVFEHTELFQRGVGDTTDVVQKEMYTFNDKGGRSITLKPEGTSPAVRAYLENNLYAQPQPTKLYYITPCYRYEKPQAGRLREFHQFGVEAFGASDPTIDSEIISMVHTFFGELGVDNLTLNINSIGCPVCRNEYNKALREYFEGRKSELCGTCHDRLETNPLRILDCKSPICHGIAEGAPVILDYLCDECREHFEGLKANLENLGIEYKIDTHIVRGLDYYTKTVFEFVSNEIGAQGTVCGGGRYDGLVEELGGQKTSGIGFGLGLERLILVLENKDIPKDMKTDIYIASIGEQAKKYAQKLAFDLRQKGFSCEQDLLSRSVKAQMKYADKLGVRYSVVLGDSEIESGSAELKNMETGEKSEIKLDEIDEFLK
ncbi:MAG: histidine--tRNA ligase [Clostridia bacterium]|nr:histidine--tRNA ligase [Clostridia bacterium]